MNVFVHFLAFTASVEGGPGPFENIDTVALFLLFLLLLIACITAGFVVLARRQIRVNRHIRQLIEAQNGFSPLQDRPVLGSTLYDQPSRWIAIRSTNLHAVLDVLKLRNTRDCTWEEGLLEARDRKLFISPPVGNWIVVMGTALPDPSDDPDRAFHFITRLSRELGHVQYFCADRIVNHHAWVRATDGHILRAYAWADEVLWNQGNMTVPEIELGMQCFEYGEDVFGTELAELIPGNMEKVSTLAARWSLDPGAIDGRLFRTHRGIAGEASSNRTL
ncbi:MAG TPA: hypothetical protein VK968_03085 [Roseimicrobium sp.]|nr:hypothetical protein [Roseimicrobium sp.]